MTNAHLRLAGFRPETLLAIDVVSKALRLAMAGPGATDVSFKAGRDVVTGSDIAVEDAIRGELRQALQLPVIGEERGGEAPGDGSPYWLVDPICGTRNFASGIPLYCVNLALVEYGQVTVAAVGDPSRDELCFAELGLGTWSLKDGISSRLAVSDASRIVMVEEGKSVGDRRKRAAEFAAGVISADSWDFRSLGSSLTLPYLAAGRVSAYAVFYITAVHAAAGTLIASEAGAVISDIDGLPWTLASDSLIASATPALHDELLAFRFRQGPEAPRPAS